MNRRSQLIILCALVVGVSVTGYNIWSLSCGRCTLHTLLTLGLPGYVLLSLNLLMAVILLLMRRARVSRERKLHCGCGLRLYPFWHYCPACGSRASGVEYSSKEL